MSDIENRADVMVFVDAFYTKVQNDELLAPIFATRIPADGWGKHLNRMYDFWETVLLNVQAYKGNPFSKHAALPVEAEHFEHWVKLFSEVMDEHFEGVRATDAKERAHKMGLLFAAKHKYYRDNPQAKTLI